MRSRPVTLASRLKPIGLVLIATVVVFAVAHWLGAKPARRGTLTKVGGAGNACTCSHRIEP
jgi:hypothetical protein